MAELIELVDAFGATALRGREITAVPVADSGEIGFELDIEGVRPLRAWQLATPVCRELGVWPFVPDERGQNVYSRHFYDEVRDGRDQAPRAILARADTLAWPLKELRSDATEYFARDWPSVIRLCRDATLQRLGQAPSEQDLLDKFPDPDYLALEHHLLTWEEARRPTSAQEPPGAFDEPMLELGDRLVLLPTPHPWAVPAYFHFWGAGSSRSEMLVRTLRSWYERYGAVPWAATSVTLHLHVSRRPTDVFDALAVASEQQPFCKMDDLLRERARSLIGATFWELYDRP